MDRIWNKLDKLGIRPERLQLEWISAAEGQKFAKVMRDLEGMVNDVTPEEIEHTMKVMAEEEIRMAEKKAKTQAKKAAEVAV
jgi:heterodisulfide reductase subunit A